MSERRVPRYEDDAELPWPMILPCAAGGPKDGRDTRLAPARDHAQHGGGGAAPLGPSGHSPRMRGEIAGAPTDDRRPTTGDSVSSQGAYPAPTAVPSVRSLAGGTALYYDAAAPTPTPRREKAAASPAPAFALCEPALVLLRLIGAYHGESDTAALLRAVAHYADAIGIHVLARPMILPCEAGEGDHAQRGGGGVTPPSSGFAVHSPRERGEIPGADAQAPP